MIFFFLNDLTACKLRTETEDNVEKVIIEKPILLVRRSRKKCNNYKILWVK